MIRPVLDERTVDLAGVYARDTDPVGSLVAALVRHIAALDRHIDAAESAGLELARVAEEPPRKWSFRAALSGDRS